MKRQNSRNLFREGYKVEEASYSSVTALTVDSRKAKAEWEERDEVMGEVGIKRQEEKLIIL